VSKEATAAVTAWVNDTRGELRATGLTQIDLDALLDAPPALAVQAALACLQLAVRQARKTDADVDGILTVPLQGSATLTHDSPTVSEVLAQSWEYGPGRQVPGLYLVKSPVWRAYEQVEEYRKDLDAALDLPDGYAAYYRTWRSQAAAEQVWEYDRTIYIRTVTS
jgi:hypothetical protein